VVYLSLVRYLTRDDVHTRPHETPAAHRLVFRYWPGPIVLVAFMMGVSFTTTTVFLTRFATELQLRGVGTFFTGYALTAFAFRILSRRWNEQLGHRTVAVLGLLGHCAGNAVLPLVSAEWHFLVPAVLSGFGHALLFPVVVSVGSGAFPREYRGTGTTLVLGFVEVGAMVGGPVLGGIIDHFGFAPMFYTAAITSLVMAAAYAVLERRYPAREHDALRRHAEPLADSAIPARPEPAPVLAECEADDDEPVALPFPHLGRSA
jgi:MFS family permease